MGMNQSDAGECSIIDEKSNTNSTNFLIFWKILTNHYGTSE
jgi:hypothetical protein